MAYIFVIPDQTDLSLKLKNKALKVREETQEYSDEGDKVILDFFEKYYPQYKDVFRYITYDDLNNLGSLTSIHQDIIRKRLKGFALATVNGETTLVEGSNILSNISKDYGVVFETVAATNKDEIKGSSASPGVATGRVKVILKKADLHDVNEGDIMVTYATSPDYVPAMKKCVAIIADEGGVVCHAAIVSRELGIPCIVGTKMATQVLKDGDLVEVNADNGTVRILNDSRSDQGLSKDGPCLK